MLKVCLLEKVKIIKDINCFSEQPLKSHCIFLAWWTRWYCMKTISCSYRPVMHSVYQKLAEGIQLSLCYHGLKPIIKFLLYCKAAAQKNEWFQLATWPEKRSGARVALCEPALGVSWTSCVFSSWFLAGCLGDKQECAYSELSWGALSSSFCQQHLCLWHLLVLWLLKTFVCTPLKWIKL